jgi:hypothetical protein
MLLVFKNMGCAVCTVNCDSFQTPVPMDPVTILLAGTLLISSLLFLLAVNKKETETARRVNKLHGPTRYPIVGTDYVLLIVKRKGETFCMRSFNLAESTWLSQGFQFTPLRFVTPRFLISIGDVFRPERKACVSHQELTEICYSQKYGGGSKTAGRLWI